MIWWKVNRDFHSDSDFKQRDWSCCSQRHCYDGKIIWVVVHRHSDLTERELKRPSDFKGWGSFKVVNENWDCGSFKQCCGGRGECVWLHFMVTWLHFMVTWLHFIVFLVLFYTSWLHLMVTLHRGAWKRWSGVWIKNCWHSDVKLTEIKLSFFV